jgi:hypothetical protein
MCLRHFFEEKLQRMAPGERISLDREAIEWMLEEHGACAASHDASPRGRAGRSSIIGLGTGELGGMFGKEPSTMRGWLRDGVFGDSERLKPNGRDYRVPHQVAEAVAEKLMSGWRVVDGELIPPLGGIPPGPTLLGTPSRRAPAKPLTTPPAAKNARDTDPDRFKGRYAMSKARAGTAA